MRFPCYDLSRNVALFGMQAEGITVVCKDCGGDDDNIKNSDLPAESLVGGEPTEEGSCRLANFLQWEAANELNVAYTQV